MGSTRAGVIHTTKIRVNKIKKTPQTTNSGLCPGFLSCGQPLAPQHDSGSWSELRWVEGWQNQCKQGCGPPWGSLLCNCCPPGVR